MSRYRLYDMQCHLDRIVAAADVAADAEALGVALFCTPVIPADSQAASEMLSSCPNVRTGVGLHPWWIDDGSLNERDMARCAYAAARSRWVGEVGLDFSRMRAGSRSEQIVAFEWICQALSEHPLPGRVLSIHAVRSAGAVMDALERFAVPSHAQCIFHWFSGTSAELVRARRLGCCFSVNERMLSTRRGREYARQLSEDCLLLETDYPPTLDASCTAADIEASLSRTAAKLADIREADLPTLAERIAWTSAKLLDL